MNNYFDTKNKKDCNGCGICALRCPKQAIIMKEDKEGFLYPLIDEKKCVNCGLCKKICSNIPDENEYSSKFFAAKNKKNSDRMNSSSGGIFKLLAENAISKGGIVFGAKFDNYLSVKHDYSETIVGCSDFSNSKYVRSNLDDCYRKAEKFLKEGLFVLFTGTPCQNYGLKKYLKKDYDKLILCEIICHSNPSPKVFELYKKNIENLSNKKIKKYYFRSKNDRFKRASYVEFEDGTFEINDTFNHAFGNMLINRPSCSNCKFCDTNRKADITIGDFWGIEKFYPELNDSKGVSLVCINSEKGLKIFNEVKEKIDYIEVNEENAFMYNHHSNMLEHRKRTKFFDGISDGSINENNIIKYMKKYIKIPLYIRIIRMIKHIFK